MDPGLQQRTQRSRREPFAKRGDNAAGNENETRHWQETPVKLSKICGKANPKIRIITGFDV